MKCIDNQGFWAFERIGQSTIMERFPVDSEFYMTLVPVKALTPGCGQFAFDVFLKRSSGQSMILPIHPDDDREEECGERKCQDPAIGIHQEG